MSSSPLLPPTCRHYELCVLSKCGNLINRTWDCRRLRLRNDAVRAFRTGLSSPKCWSPFSRWMNFSYYIPCEVQRRQGILVRVSKIPCQRKECNVNRPSLRTLRFSKVRKSHQSNVGLPQASPSQWRCKKNFLLSPVFIIWPPITWHK